MTEQDNTIPVLPKLRRKDFGLEKTTQVHANHCKECGKPVSKPHDKKCSRYKGGL